MQSVKVNGPRLIKTIHEFSEIGRLPDGGVSRFTFAQADMEARKYVCRLMEDSGFQVQMDPFANIVGRLEGASRNAPAILCGSHIDTVPQGGFLDGAYGVLSGIEAVRTVKDKRLQVKAPLEVVVFTEEEGTRFPSFIGSMGFAGLLEKEQAYTRRDQNGTTFQDAMKDAGLDLLDLRRIHRSRNEVGAYVELHIEQGPFLERERTTIGIVTSIVGLAELSVVVQGSPGHAGTTPMSLRHDPLLTASRIILGIDAIARQSSGSVATVGSVVVSPNASNVIPGNVTLGIDFRHPNLEGLQSVRNEIVSLVNRIAKEDNAKATIKEKSFTKPALMSRRVVEAIARSAESLDIKYRPMHSGAGHDCQNMAEFTEVGMIFVPSQGGISHSPKESTAPEDLKAGANVLLNTLVQLANQ